MTSWSTLWERRQLPPAGGSLLAGLMAADGLDSGFAGVSEQAWRAVVDVLIEALGLTGSETSVFEVGCGAGALLLPLADHGCPVGGVDISPALVARARQVLPAGNFAVGDAAEFAVDQKADAVLSFGVLLYLQSLAHAERVLDRMVEKTERVVAVLDVPDLGVRDADLARREQLAGGKEAYARRYTGLEHLYFSRDWVRDALTRRGLVGVRVSDQAIEGYGNAPYRFNAWGFKPR